MIQAASCDPIVLSRWPLLNPLGLIPHKRFFGFVGGPLSGRIEKWEHGLGRYGRLGSLSASYRRWR